VQATVSGNTGANWNLKGLKTELDEILKNVNYQADVDEVCPQKRRSAPAPLAIRIASSQQL